MSMLGAYVYSVGLYTIVWQSTHLHVLTIHPTQHSNTDSSKLYLTIN